MAITNRNKERKRNIKKALPFYLFISPWLLGFFLLTLSPMIFSLYASFTEWGGIDTPKFVGIANFKEMFFVDERFWVSVKNTLIYAIVSVPLNIMVALILAIMVNRRLPGSYFFRSVFYLPSVVSGVSVFLVWTWLYDPNIGIFNYVLSLIGIQGPSWLLDPNWAMLSLIIMSVSFCGGQMLIFLAGLQDIPEEYFEAARIDGASKMKAFFAITLPLLTPVVFFNLIMGIIGGFQVFTQPWVMTEGGPMQATYVYGIHLYNTAFRYYNFGYASSLAWILFLIILSLSLFVLKTSKKWVYNQGRSN